MITAYVWDISYDFVSYNFRLPQCTVVKIVFVLNNDFTKYIEKFKTFAISKIAKKNLLTLWLLRPRKNGKKTLQGQNYL